MINLLPPQIREATLYANKNTKLRAVAVSLLVLLSLVVMMFIGGAIYLAQASKTTAKQAEVTRNQLKLEDQESTKKQVSELAGTFKLVDQVLSEQVLFSKLLQKIGSIVPNGTVLTGLSISELGEGIDLQAKATNYDSATQLHVNLEDKENALFKQVDILNIQCQANASDSEENSKYPCTVQMRALFGDTNPFLFLNDGVENE